MNTSEIDLDMHIGLDEESDFTDINGSSISIKTLLQRSVQSICWTYSIYWKFSHNKGLLEWNDGFYNGEIKTRRTVQMANGSSDELCGERSLQLRDLFISLGREDEVLQPQPRRRLASLSPEDLTDVEWFYLVSMSFEFRPPNGLPGRAFANSCPVWLCRAAQADSTTFSRNLLAKSAGIETVLCIPLTNGVLELGVTRMVVENTDIVECIRGMLNGEIAVLGDTYSARSGEEGSILDVTHHSHSGGSEEEDMTTASDDMDSDMQRKTTQTWSCLQLGMETQEAQSGQDMSFNVAEASSMSSSFHGAFAKWSSNEAQNSLPLVKSEILEKGSQVLLKRVLMNSTHLMGATKSSSQCNSSDDNCGKIPSNEVHVLAERNRRNKINEKFRALRSLVPFVTKTDKASVLSDAINYLKHLQERVEELDNKIKENEQQSNTKASYFQNNIEDPESHKKFKRKLGEADEGSATSSEVTRKIEIEVSIIDEVALIELSCGFKEGLILHMMEVLSSLKIEPYDLQCSRSNDDWFIGTIKANVKKQRGGQRVTIPRVKEAIRAILP